MASAAAACLSGCTAVAEKTTELFSSNVDAIGMLDGRILRGQASFASEREATVHLQSSDAPSLTCFGTLRYTASSSGAVNFSCNNGQSAMVHFKAFSRLRGAGRGLLDNTEFALTFGLPPEKAAGYLALPVDRLVPPKASTTAPAPGVDH